MVDYVISTNLPPEALTEIGLKVFEMWTAFAMGQISLGGKRIIWPTGRYAASLQFEQRGEYVVAITANENYAPEAAILEEGHGVVDLKTRMAAGVYPMHRFQGGGPRGAAMGLRRRGVGRASMQPSMWAAIREGEANGYATLSPNSPAGSWILPAMPAYSPAQTLSRIVSQYAK